MVGHKDHLEVQEFEKSLTEVGQELASRSIRHTSVAAGKLDKALKNQN